MWALFIGQNGNASGGWNDWEGTFSEKRDACDAGRRFNAANPNAPFGQMDWWHVVFLPSCTIVEEGECEPLA